MAALVADYNSTSSGERESESSSENDETDNEYSDHVSADEKETEKLPLPDILNDGSSASGDGHEGGQSGQTDNRSCSVFFNPFKAKEDAKLAILEKHVKLSEPRNENETERRKFRKKKKGQRRQVHVETNNADDIDSFRTLGKRRIGVTDSIVPPKKSLKAYDKQRQQERQRTSTKGRDT